MTYAALALTLLVIAIAAIFLMLCHLERMADIARNEVDVL